MNSSPSVLRIQLDRPGFRLDIDVEWSERVAVVFGPSGSGKTTLFEAVLGLHPGASVETRLAGEWLDDPESGLRVPVEERRLGWVPQDPTLFPHLTVAGNLRFGLQRAGQEGTRALDRAVDVLEIGDLLDRTVDALSGGERQRVALARAIASGPRALLLDEPLAALDLPLRARVLPYLLRVRDELDLPMLYITHDPDEAMLLGEIALVLDRGRLVATGPPREVLWTHDVRPLSEALGLENVLDGRACEDGRAIRTALGLELRVPWQLELGSTARVGLRAEDVLLALDKPGRISARNVVPGVVRSCETRGDSVWVEVEAGDRVIAKLTADAARKLDLREHQRVFLVFKAQALRRLG